MAITTRTAEEHVARSAEYEHATIDHAVKRLMLEMNFRSREEMERAGYIIDITRKPSAIIQIRMYQVVRAVEIKI